MLSQQIAQVGVLDFPNTPHFIVLYESVWLKLVFLNTESPAYVMSKLALAEGSIDEIKPESTRLLILSQTLNKAGYSNGLDFTKLFETRPVTLEMLQAIHSGNDVLYLAFLL
ncbi:hypothetical protein ACFL3Q_14880 [Planctomycetota bacterium]